MLLKKKETWNRETGGIEEGKNDMKDFENLRNDLAEKEEAGYDQELTQFELLVFDMKRTSNFRNMDEAALAKALKENLVKLYKSGTLTQAMVDRHDGFFRRHGISRDLAEQARLHDSEEIRYKLRREVGHQLQTVREERNIRLTEIAPILGLTPKEISDVEFGWKEASLDTIIAYSHSLGIKVTIDPTSIKL